MGVAGKTKSRFFKQLIWEYDSAQAQHVMRGEAQKMRIIAILFVALAQVSGTSVSPSMAQTSTTPLCDGVAAQIRKDGTGDWKSLAGRNPPYVELSSEPDMRVVKDA